MVKDKNGSGFRRGMAITLALHRLTRGTQTRAVVHDRKGYEASSVVTLGERARMTVMVSALGPAIWETGEPVLPRSSPSV